MANLSLEFDRAERQGLIHLVHSTPQLSIGELRQLLGRGRIGALLSTISFDELIEGSPDVDGLARHRAVHGVSKITTRSTRGRDRYDAKVLEALSTASRPVPPVELLERVGGGTDALRASLRRLTSQRKIQRVPLSGGSAYRLRAEEVTEKSPGRGRRRRRSRGRRSRGGK